MALEPGVVVAGRFVVEKLVGAGGMGQVYRATDGPGGPPVALKVLREGSDLEGRRFVREAAVLARIEHEAVVGYVAHGVTEAGRLYLAMQWLDGEDLLARLRRQRLTLAETVRLGLRLTSALEALHERGVFHRDLKPANVFLPDRDPARAMLLDLGVARVATVLADLTVLSEDHDVLGTPTYTAPEQARGQVVDGRTDLHALGVVLWECLTHGRAFLARDVMAVLARVLFEVLPPPSEKVEGIPDALDALVVRLLSKKKDERPESAAAVRAILESIDVDALDAPPVPTRISVLSGLEQRVVSVVVGVVPETSTGGGPSTVEAFRARVAPVAARHGARLEVLGDGGLVALVEAEGSARRSAVQAARLARALSGHARRLAVSTGRVVRGQGVPVGDAIDRATALVALASPPGAIRLDDTTAAALSEAFEVVDAGDALYLGMPLDPRATPAPATLDGREADVARVLAALAEVRREGQGRALVLTAAPGMGKTRLASALAAELAPACEVIVARGDPMRSGSPYDALAPALREALGAAAASDLGAARATVLAAAVEAVGEDGPALAVLLGELAGVPFPAPRALEALRADPRQLASLLAAAFVRFVGARARARPIAFVVDDGQWADRASVGLLEATLRSGAPVLVVLLARPELDDAHPGLFADAPVDRQALAPLTRGAATRLADRLAPDLAPAVRDDVVGRAGGNPFFLRELVRAQRRGGAFPESVLATVQARLDALDAKARRVLRAASVLGVRFFEGAVDALVGAEEPPPRAEVASRRSGPRALSSPSRAASRVSASSASAALVRDACYATLTEDDRRRGHRLAARLCRTWRGRRRKALARHLDEAALPEEAAPSAPSRRRDGRSPRTTSAAVVRLRVRALTRVRSEGRRGGRGAGGEARIRAGEQAEARRAAHFALEALEAGRVGAVARRGLRMARRERRPRRRDGGRSARGAPRRADRCRPPRLRAGARAGRSTAGLPRALGARGRRRAARDGAGSRHRRRAAPRGAPRERARAPRGDGGGSGSRRRTPSARPRRPSRRRARRDGRALSVRTSGSKLLEPSAVSRWLAPSSRPRSPPRAKAPSLRRRARGAEPRDRAPPAGDHEARSRWSRRRSRRGPGGSATPARSRRRGRPRGDLAALGRGDDACGPRPRSPCTRPLARDPRAAALAVLARPALDDGDAGQALALAEEATALAAREPMLDRELYLMAVLADALVANDRRAEGRRVAASAWATSSRR
ncbi:MAG: protein kinase [Sandaracinaceae bacterium]